MHCFSGQEMRGQEGTVCPVQTTAGRPAIGPGYGLPQQRDCCELSRLHAAVKAAGHSEEVRKAWILDEQRLRDQHRQWAEQKDAAYPGGSRDICKLPGSCWVEKFRWRGMLTEAAAGLVEQSPGGGSANDPAAPPR